MHYRASSLAVLSAAALVLSGCEWGGVHENTWNDSYSWLNFTGTYALSELAALSSSGSSSSEDESSGSGTTVSTATFTSSGSKDGKTFSGSYSLKGSNPRVTSFSVSLGGMGTATGDIETGRITLGENITGSFTTQGSQGTWSVTYDGNEAGMPDSATASGSYTYEGVVTPGGGGGSSSGGTTISYLHVTQKGNVIDISDSAGNTYHGKTTGSSTPADGYVNAGSVQTSFEASGSRGRIVGSLTGVWSGSTDKGHGTLSSRTIHATMTVGGSNVDVVGTAPNMVIAVDSSETTTTE